MQLEEKLAELSVELASLKHITNGLDNKGDLEIHHWVQNVESISHEKDEMHNQLDKLRHQDSSNDWNAGIEELDMRVSATVKVLKALKGRAFETFMHHATKDGRLKRYSHDDLTSFTSTFSNKIGLGGFSNVYRGQLPEGTHVAVKVLTVKEAVQDIFVIEVSTMIKASHSNLIKLYGFCFDDDMKALVYEYMEKGSLDKLLLKKDSTVEWRTFYDIMIGVAKVLAHLHHDCEVKFIHHDIKPANVLLDYNLSPKVTDFGVANIMNTDVNHYTMTRVRGTFWYIAPEMVMQSSRVTSACDVYSFGKMLFDILGMRINNTIQTSFPHKVWAMFDKGEPDEIIKECEILEKDRESARILCIVALWCIQFTP